MTILILYNANRCQPFIDMFALHRKAFRIIDVIEIIIDVNSFTCELLKLKVVKPCWCGSTVGL